MAAIDISLLQRIDIVVKHGLRCKQVQFSRADHRTVIVPDWR